MTLNLTFSYAKLIIDSLEISLIKSKKETKDRKLFNDADLQFISYLQ